MSDLETLKAQHPDWCFVCGREHQSHGHYLVCTDSPVIAALFALVQQHEAEIERLTGVCEGWGRKYQSWVDGAEAEKAGRITAEAELAKAQETIAELRQSVTLAESAHDDDLAMRAEVRGFVADLYAERGQDARVAFLCNRALALLKP